MINYKGRNIILDGNMEFVKKEIYEDKELVLEAGKLKNNFMNNAQALIHGDLHSGSIFLNRESTKVLDPEFAFYGPMGYDIGNVIGNLYFAWANIYFTKNHDDSKEFLEWIEIRNFDFENPVIIEGYTAKQVYAIEPSLDVAGVYNFMVTLREEPDKAKDYIKRGFPTK